MTDFKTRAREAALKKYKPDYSPMCHGHSYDRTQPDRDIWEQGALWSRAETLREVIQALENGGGVMTDDGLSDVGLGPEWAHWLRERFGSELK